MTEEHRLISAESVTEGHPDKVCDQISDAILDDLLAQDSSSHVAVETSAATGVFLVFGEVTSEGYCDVQSKVRETLRNIGYTSSEVGLDADSCGVVVAITEQSAEINQGVARLTGDQETAASREERYEAQGAGDRHQPADDRIPPERGKVAREQEHPRSDHVAHAERDAHQKAELLARPFVVVRQIGHPVRIPC